MQVFVTGGSGYLGRNLIRELVSRGDQVHALARSDQAAETVEALGATAVRGDLLDHDALRTGMAGCGYAVHSAADTSTRPSTPSRTQREANVDGTLAVLAAARAAGVPRVVHVSTEAVLADGGPLVKVDESAPIPRKHAGPYSATKAEAERAALAANRDGLEVVVVRPRFIWGRDDTTLLPPMVKAARSGGMPMIGGGHYLTSTCHVANVVAGILAAAERGAPGEVYFLTDGEPVESRDFICRMLATQGAEPRVLTLPMPVARGLALLGNATARLPGPQVPLDRQILALIGHEMTVSDAKARREIGYENVISIEEGLAELTAYAD
jgi:nucleoside-diphosphate-sugar epimerase